MSCRIFSLSRSSRKQSPRQGFRCWQFICECKPRARWWRKKASKERENMMLSGTLYLQVATSLWAHHSEGLLMQHTEGPRKEALGLRAVHGRQEIFICLTHPLLPLPRANVDSEEITPPTSQCVTWPLGGCSESQIPRSHTLWHGVTSKFTSREVTWHKWGVNQERKKETVEGIWETQSLYPKTHINFWEWIKTEETVRGDQVKCWAFL